MDVYNWTLDEQNELKIIPPTPQSIDQWMIINPVAFTIESGKEQVVRFSIRPRTTPTPGEHRAIIYFSEQPSPYHQGGVELLFKLGIGIYAYADPVHKNGSLSGISLNRSLKTINVELANTGNVHTRLKGAYAIWKKGTFPGFKTMQSAITMNPDEKKPEGFVAGGSMNNLPVLAGSKKTIVTQIPLPESNPNGYDVAVTGTVDDQRIEKLFP
ncbi:MAG: molecular chaperone [Chlorobium phaeovibrioides]|nr:molecular chaperone [Chlorobium phaeovibrioides]